MLNLKINPVKRSFYAACDSIFSHSHGTSEIALLTLQEAYSLSVLLYASPALTFQCRQTGELNACWNDTIRYDTIEEFNVDSKAEDSALSSTRSQKRN